MYIIFVLLVVLAMLGFFLGHSQVNKAYWKGRNEGWLARENLALDQAKKAGPKEYAKMIEYLR